MQKLRERVQDAGWEEVESSLNALEACVIFRSAYNSLNCATFDCDKEDCYMGLGEMLGVKVAKLDLKGNYTSMENFYEAIKDIKFEAGLPALVKHGFNQVIVFPEQDRNNQVWIMNAGKGKYQVMRSSEVAGLNNLVKNAVLDELTDGWSSMSGAFGDKKKRCMELVDITARQIQEAGI